MRYLKLMVLLAVAIFTIQSADAQHRTDKRMDGKYMHNGRHYKHRTAYYKNHHKYYRYY